MAYTAADKQGNIRTGKYKFLVLLLLLISKVWLASAQTDSLVLSYQEYVDNIVAFHPVAQKARLKAQYAEAGMMGAKGSRDPYIDASWSSKELDDKLYYEKLKTKLVFPTSLGVTFSGGYENTDGAYLNPENKTDEYGLWNLGVEMDVLNGLLTNERKTAIRQAREYQHLYENEQNMLLNDLLFNALYSYHTWQMYYYSMEILTENISIAHTYNENTRNAYSMGEKTAMDTLESSIAYREAISLFNKNELYLVKARQKLENYLWYNGQALKLQPGVKPESYDAFYTNEWAEFDSVLINNHPLILTSINKLSLTEIEQRLKREKLKPKLKIKYDALLTTSDDIRIHGFDMSDYKLGVGFSMPLFLRSERAGVRKGKLKIQELELDIMYKKNELYNKAEASRQQQNILKDQIEIYEQNAVNYERLLEGENEKFRYGESSVFLLNKRQEKYIDGKLKLTEAYVKYRLELLRYLYLSNQLVTNQAE
ncbi:TolC family protein [Carboxylicivirga sp. RSCT41]|uniref:TolC family protein n=1 Tax=Carboxylicivirga agarovorans TaxID=3417570 RepID=UPI003D33E78F